MPHPTHTRRRSAAGLRPREAAPAAMSTDAAPARPPTPMPQPRHHRQLYFWVLIGIVTFLMLSIAVNRTAVERSWRGFLSDNGLALAALQPLNATQSTLYTVNLATGLLTPVGAIGPAGTQPLVGFMIRFQ